MRTMDEMPHVFMVEMPPEWTIRASWIGFAMHTDADGNVTRYEGSVRDRANDCMYSFTARTQAEIVEKLDERLIGTRVDA